MDLRGVELSESPSIAASPITVIILTFPLHESPNDRLFTLVAS